MPRRIAPITLLLVLLATACAGSQAGSGSAASEATNAPALAQAPAPSTWTRPMDVAPLVDLPAAATVGGKAAAGAGLFQVISEAPWPGEKVRVFFFGVQG